MRKGAWGGRAPLLVAANQGRLSWTRPYGVVPFTLSATFIPSCNPIKPALPETLKSDRMVESKSLGCGKLCPRNIAERPSNSQSAGTLLCTNNAAVSRATSSVNCSGESVGVLLLVGVVLVGVLPGGELLGGRLL